MKSFTKTKLLIFFFLLISIFAFVYFYVYKSHREISSEDAAFNVNATELLEEFQTDEATATTKYANLTIEIYGEITKLDLENNIIFINDGISVQMVAFEKQLNVSESKDGKRLPTTVLKFNRVERPTHPTEKPVELLEWLIKSYTNEGDMVLDNTMGSGTTNLACIKLNRKSIGIEKEKQYYDVAVRRALEYCH